MLSVDLRRRATLKMFPKPFQRLKMEEIQHQYCAFQDKLFWKAHYKRAQHRSRCDKSAALQCSALSNICFHDSAEVVLDFSWWTMFCTQMSKSLTFGTKKDSRVTFRRKAMHIIILTSSEMWTMRWRPHYSSTYCRGGVLWAALIQNIFSQKYIYHRETDRCIV